jgi:hypothetical protein
MPQDARSWQAFNEAAPRLERGSGEPIFAALGGYPVRAVERPAGVTQCANTTVTFYSLTKEFVSAEIDLYWPIPDGCYPSLTDSLTHEMIHALRGAANLDLGNQSDGHSATGVFAKSSDDSRLDSASLEKLCDAVDCTVFVPETEKKERRSQE